MGILTEEMKRVVAEQRLGFVATVCADGTPNLSPKGTTAVWDDDHLVFVDLASPGTVGNLRQNPSVEVNVVDQVARKGYRFKGRAEVIEEGPRLDEVLAVYAGKDDMLAEVGKRARAAVLIRIEQAAPLISPGYAWVETEQEMRTHWLAYWHDLWESRRPD